MLSKDVNASLRVRFPKRGKGRKRLAQWLHSVARDLSNASDDMYIEQPRFRLMRAERPK